MPHVVLETGADSLALLAYNAAGGVDVWSHDHVPYVRFDFGGADPTTRRRHLWNRMTGQYRIERPMGPDTTVVTLFNVDTKEGQAYYNETPVADSLNSRMIESAHRMFINDTYWLLMPTKLFDEGVQRSLVPDSSTADHGVLRLSFSSVGYTPGDSYWIWINRQSGLVDKWHYKLQRGSESTRLWVDYQTFEIDGMTARLAARKESPDGTSALHTGPIELPRTVSPDWFTAPGGSLAGPAL